jgi:hypothetical protein
MPSGVVAGYFKYPQLPPLIAAEYTCGHGTTPGTVVLRTHPGTAAPVAFGDVEIGDGRKALTLPACKLIRFTAERDDGGNEWLIELEDARWRWRGGRIDGRYNQLDRHGKLIPRMVRSPTELADLCLDAMGVDRRYVDMPDGVDSTQVLDGLPDFLPVGVNFPTGLNPPVDWYAENPAAALAALADLCGRRIVYDPVNDRVLVVRVGLGEELPDGHIHNVTPSAVATETPDAVEVVGDPTRYETMFELQAVGLEWDGSIRPIDELSYAPEIVGRTHEVVYEIGILVVGLTYGLKIEVAGGAQALEFQRVAGGGDTVTTVIDALAALVNAHPDFAGKLDATNVSDELTLIGAEKGFTFDVNVSDGNGRQSVRVVRAGAADRRGWDFSPPPTYPNVKATDRLTRLQAVQMAARSVWRMFRITGRDATTLKEPISIPDFGPVAARQNIVLLDELCEQVVPEPGDKRVADRDGQPLIRNLYDGYSRAKPAEVYGSVCSACFGGSEFWFIGDGLVNKGAAAVGAAAVGAAEPTATPEARIVTWTALNSAVGTEFHLKFSDPDAVPQEETYTALLADTATTAAAGLEALLNANAVIAGKVTVSRTGAVITLTAKKPALLFEVTTTTTPTFAAVATLKTGSGAAAPKAPPPDAAPLSPSDAMTPTGEGKGSSLNTDPSDRVYVDFTVDATWQMITFAQPVWFAGAGLVCKEPKLFLRAACNVRDEQTQQLVAYSDRHTFRDGPNVHIAKRPDVQLNVIGEYRIGKKKGGDSDGPGGGAMPAYCWTLKKTKLLEADAVLRARAYLDAELFQFQIKGGVVVEYNGIEPVPLDGKTQQVTYKVAGGVGTMTTASSNMEHSTWVPPYPARRRAENLAAVARGGAPGAARVDNPGAGRTPLPPGAT